MSAEAKHCSTKPSHEPHTWTSDLLTPDKYACDGSAVEPTVQVPVSLIDDAMVERAARALFEGADGVSPGDYSWDDVVRNDGSRARLWRADARQVLEAALIQNGADR